MARQRKDQAGAAPGGSPPAAPQEESTAQAGGSEVSPPAPGDVFAEDRGAGDGVGGEGAGEAGSTGGQAASGTAPSGLEDSATSPAQGGGEGAGPAAAVQASAELAPPPSDEELSAAAKAKRRAELEREVHRLGNPHVRVNAANDRRVAFMAVRAALEARLAQEQGRLEQELRREEAACSEKLEARLALTRKLAAVGGTAGDCDHRQGSESAGRDLHAEVRRDEHGSIEAGLGALLDGVLDLVDTAVLRPRVGPAARAA